MKQIKVTWIIVLAFLLGTMLEASIVVDSLEISYDIDTQNHKPIKPTGKITDNTRRIYVSAWVRDATANTKITFKWYQYTGEEHMETLRQSDMIVSGTRFVYSSITNAEEYPFPEGEYLVDIFINNKLETTTSFEVYKTIGENISQWQRIVNKSVALANQGKYTQALLLLDKSLKIAKKQTPVNYEHVVSSLNSIVTIYTNLGDKKKAESYAMRAIDTLKKTIGFHGDEAASALASMAKIYKDKNDIDKTESYLLQALGILKKSPKHFVGKIVSISNELSEVYLLQEQDDKAEKLVMQTLKMIEKYNYTKDAYMAETLVALSKVYMVKNQNDKAEKYLLQALDIMNALPNPEPITVSGILGYIQLVYTVTKQYKKAEIFAKKNIVIQRKIFGSKNQQTISSLKDLAAIYRESGQPQKAQKIDDDIIRLVGTHQGLSERSHRYDCGTFDRESEKKMLISLLKRYPSISVEMLKKYEPGRYYDKKHGVNIVVPYAWKFTTDKGDDILCLTQGDNVNSGKLILKSLTKFWNEVESKKPKVLIKRVSKLIIETFAKSATKIGDKSKSISPIKIFTHNNHTISHFVSHRTGKKTRWESNTLIWDGKKLYLLSILSKDDEALQGEFLYSLAVESFCSDGIEEQR